MMTMMMRQWECNNTARQRETMNTTYFASAVKQGVVDRDHGKDGEECGEYEDNVGKEDVELEVNKLEGCLQRLYPQLNALVKQFRKPARLRIIDLCYDQIIEKPATPVRSFDRSNV